jgi:hypothetical protein
MGDEPIHLVIMSERAEMINETLGNMDPLSGATFIFALLLTQDQVGTETNHDGLYYSLSLRHNSNDGP